MKKADVVSFFGNESRTARFLGVSHQAVNQWDDIIPVEQALWLDEMTDLEFDKKMYQNGQNNAGEGQ